jgi:hypothetical protein
MVELSFYPHVPFAPFTHSASPDAPPHLYVMCAYGKGVSFYKIGVSRNVEKRLSNIRSANALNVDLLQVVAFGGDSENQIHYDLGKWRTHGEWFDSSPEVESYLRDNLMGGIFFVHGPCDNEYVVAEDNVMAEKFSYEYDAREEGIDPDEDPDAADEYSAQLVKPFKRCDIPQVAAFVDPCSA